MRELRTVVTQRIGTEELFREHAEFVAAFLFRLGVDSSNVEDLVQEVFLIAHRKGGYEPGPAVPRTWLGAIALRLASSSRRQRTRSREDVDEERLARAASSGKTPEESAQVNDSLRRVQEALDSMDFEHRAAFVLYELEGMPCREIATTLSVPIGTVYSRLHTARRQFSQAHEELVASERRKMARSA